MRVAVALSKRVVMVKVKEAVCPDITNTAKCFLRYTDLLFNSTQTDFAGCKMREKVNAAFKNTSISANASSIGGVVASHASPRGRGTFQRHLGRDAGRIRRGRVDEVPTPLTLFDRRREGNVFRNIFSA